MFFLHAFLCLLLYVGRTSSLVSEERGSSAPFISGDTFRAVANHVFDETTKDFSSEKVQYGDLIFVKTDWEYLTDFFINYHPMIMNPYILITHNSDHSAPGPFYDYLEDSKLLAWFAQNVEGDFHIKLHPIPIGIANRCWSHGNPAIFSSCLEKSQEMNKTILCYINFSPSTYPEERMPLLELFASQSWCTVSSPKALSSYLQDLASSKFVLSPRGNGLDCHRTWEALLMGAIPIVRSSHLDSMFQDLPVLIVQNWEDITESYLEFQYNTIKQKQQDLSKLFIDYWIECIHKERNE